MRSVQSIAFKLKLQQAVDQSKIDGDEEFYPEWITLVGAFMARAIDAGIPLPSEVYVQAPGEVIIDWKGSPVSLTFYERIRSLAKREAAGEDGVAYATDRRHEGTFMERHDFYFKDGIHGMMQYLVRLGIPLEVRYLP